MDANMVTKILDEIGRRLSGPAEHVWGILVKQALVEGIIGIIVAIVCTGICFGLYKTTKYLYKKNQKHKENSRVDIGNVNCEFGMIFGFIFFVVALGIGIFNLISSIGKLINPEYYAIMDILNQLPK